MRVPNTHINSPSDIDICVMYKGDPVLKIKRLQKIAKRLELCDEVKDLDQILGARVPILECKTRDYDIDISVNAPDVSVAVAWFHEQMKAYPSTADLALIVKTMLHKQGLMNTKTGGISSTVIFCLITAFMKVWHYLLAGGNSFLSDLMPVSISTVAREARPLSHNLLKNLSAKSLASLSLHKLLFSTHPLTMLSGTKTPRDLYQYRIHLIVSTRL